MNDGQRVRVSRWQVIFIGAVLLTILIYIGGRTFGSFGAPKLASFELINTDHNRGCWAIITDASCYTAYTYVGKGSLESAIAAVYADFSKNPNYQMDRSLEDSISDQAIMVIYKNAKSQSGSDWGFVVDFMAPPAPTDKYRGFFKPTEDCGIGSHDCVEAQIVE